MSTNHRATSQTGDTQPTEIPTQQIEGVVFDDDSNTEDKTVDMTDPDADSAGTPDLQKFRRPTRSEILEAVDAVNTESLDVSQLAQARALESGTEDVFDYDDVDDDEDEEG